MRGARRRLPLILGLTIGVLAASGGTAGVGAAGRTPVPGGPDRGGALLPAGRTYAVTLLTGDVVTVSTRTSGCPTISIRPAHPNGVAHRSCGPDGHVRVIPGEVAGLLGSVLDESLFDVTTLILNGYDDGRTKELPLIVRPGAAGARTAATLAAAPLAAGLTQRRALPTIAAVAGHQPKQGGAGFLAALSKGSTARAGVSAADSGPHVWLDRRVSATGAAPTALAATPRLAERKVPTQPAGPVRPGKPKPKPDAGGLDRNLEQISAPQAWRAGVTGTGTRVAVLDTGADFTHPDLVGKVVDRADFTADGGDAVDHYGHGTHVAATIAGTGAGADGKRQGVAPGASLLVGKVLGDDGGGSDSQVIAGMEWAAARADVVNMSLGGSEASDGSDPTSLAVDALTKQYGALFVVAAGNSGPADGLVSGPGAAASALTVGAVDGADALADFSSHGPLINTHAAKPELVAPGVDIVAARAAGTTMGRPIDAGYTAGSGTSMATPHVAGAAALLAQRHPDWQAAQLKSALVGAADQLPGADGYAVGAGRLNAARALDGPVAGQAVVNLGTFSYPQSGTGTAKLSWTNPGAGAANLGLSVAVKDRRGTTAPAGTATLSTDALALGSGGTGTATLTIDRSRLAPAPGWYTAVVTARTADGGFVAGTPVAFFVEPPSHDLTLSATSLPNAPAGAESFGYAIVVNLEDPALFAQYLDVPVNGTLTVRVPAGRYGIHGAVMESDAATGGQRIAVVGDSDVAVTGATALVLDAGRAAPVRASVDGVPTEASMVSLVHEYLAADAGWSVSDVSAYAWGESAANWGVYAVPMSAPGIGSFTAYTSFSLDAPGHGPSPYVYDLIRALPGGGIPADLTYRVTSAEQARLARIDQRFQRLDKPGTSTDHKRYGISPLGSYLLEESLNDVPATRTDYVSPGYAYIDEAFYSGVVEYPAVTQEMPRTYAPGSRQEKIWVRQPLRPDWFDDQAAAQSDCQVEPVSRSNGNLRVQLVDLTDQHQRFDCLGFGDLWDQQTTRKLALYRDGTLVGDRPESFGNFTIPSQAGNYRLSYELDASALLPVSTRVNTAWTFRSTGPAGNGSAAVPLLSVDYALPLDANNHPAAGAATFTVQQSYGVAKQKVTSFEVWTSTDDGANWQLAPARSTGSGTFAAQLPAPAAGQAVSLRVRARADGGSGIEQTIIRAYRAG